MIYLVLIICGIFIWLYMKYQVQTMSLFSNLMAKGWKGVNQEESIHIRCSHCSSVIRRGSTTPYCTKCNKFV
ncbi:hypothetical protein [Jeotgalibacillus aurantiacus]|uniref:hypothetical protein n=1 Tax=Jeotgalibacillus aurantiacus TaxID=2763266 RepID=UPI001D09D738|nr:hypothetical protein [Jeotgalibacillus aurantiacus]